MQLPPHLPNSSWRKISQTGAYLAMKNTFVHVRGRRFFAQPLSRGKNTRMLRSDGWNRGLDRRAVNVINVQKLRVQQFSRKLALLSHETNGNHPLSITFVPTMYLFWCCPSVQVFTSFSKPMLALTLVPHFQHFNKTYAVCMTLKSRALQGRQTISNKYWLKMSAL